MTYKTEKDYLKSISKTLKDAALGNIENNNYILVKLLVSLENIVEKLDTISTKLDRPN